MTLSYKQLAINIGKPNAARAVANACGKNPRPIKTPCHRVIKSDKNSICRKDETYIFVTSEKSELLCEPDFLD